MASLICSFQRWVWEWLLLNWHWQWRQRVLSTQCPQPPSEPQKFSWRWQLKTSLAEGSFPTDPHKGLQGLSSPASWSESPPCDRLLSQPFSPTRVSKTFGRRWEEMTTKLVISFCAPRSWSTTFDRVVRARGPLTLNIKTNIADSWRDCQFLKYLSRKEQF